VVITLAQPEERKFSLQCWI